MTKKIRIRTMDDVIKLIGPQPRLPREDEDLHPDLETALVRKGKKRQLVHPFCCEEYELGFNFRYNADYQEWGAARGADLAARDWKTYIMAHAENFRIDALLSLTSKANAGEWSEAARSLWYLSDRFWDRMDRWREVLEIVVASSGWMSPEEAAQLENQRDPLTIFRGCRKETIKGFSWSLEYENAYLHARPAYGKGIVVQGSVDRTNIIALLDRVEDEKEIVVFPEHVGDIVEA